MWSTKLNALVELNVVPSTLTQCITTRMLNFALYRDKDQVLFPFSTQHIK